jgi:chaperone BCS1
MNTVSLPERYQNLFFNYIEPLKIKCDTFTVVRHEENDMVVPGNTTFSIDFEDSVVVVAISRENESPLFDGNSLTFLLKITLRHDSLDLLKRLVVSILECRYIKNGASIQLFHSRHCGYWDRGNRVYGQTLENIFLPSEVKNSVINHIDSFLANRERYLKFGRTYKLCFLFTGVPGAGKSSFIKSIALKYNRPIYILSLSKKLEDESLQGLMGEVKENSIIVLEDIDSFFIDREANDVNVSFSAILNLFDGLFTPGNGTILFMTANNPKRLDNALVRPGRVDKIVQFEYPRKREINDAFNSIVGGSDFNEFHKLLKGDISMAAIIDYLFRHPDDYLANIDELNDQTKLLCEINDGNASFYK